MSRCGHDVIEHPVEGRSEFTHLGFGNPHRQCDLAAVQRQIPTADLALITLRWILSSVDVFNSGIAYRRKDYIFVSADARSSRMYSWPTNCLTVWSMRAYEG